MMGKFKAIEKIMLVPVCFIIVLTGCNSWERFGELPDNPIVFEQGTYQNPNNADDTYACIVFDGRIYVPYGTLGSGIDKNVVGECIGYIYDGENPDDTGVRIYTLKGDDEKNYLMNILIEAFMEQPVFYRAIDTKGEEIYTPKFIDTLNYDCWK